MSETTIGWLLNRSPDGHNQYFTLENGVAEWTNRAADGLRFARQIDAASYAAFFLDANVIAVRATFSPGGP